MYTMQTKVAINDAASASAAEYREHFASAGLGKPAVATAVAPVNVA